MNIYINERLGAFSRVSRFKAFLATFKQFRQLVGERVFWIQVLSTGIGVGLGFSEVAFVYSVQALFEALKVIQASSSGWPNPLQGFSVLSLVGFLILASLIRALVMGLQTSLQDQVPEFFRMRLREKLLLSTFRGSSASSQGVINLFTEKTQMAGHFVRGLQVFGSWSVLCVLLIGIMSYYSFKTAICCFSLAVLFFVPLRFVQRAMKKNAHLANSHWDALVRRLVMDLKNFLFLRVHGMAEREEGKLLKWHSTYSRIVRKLSWENCFAYVYPQLVGAILIAVVTVIAYQAAWLEGGAVLIFFYLFIRALQAISMMSFATGLMTLHYPGFKDIWHAFIKMDKEIHRARLDGPLSAQSKGFCFDQPFGWEFENVSFRYDPDQPWILKDASFSVPAGRLTVIQGASGIGKSTLFSLMLGEYEPEAGKVWLYQGGRRFELWELSEKIKDSIGYVGPEPFLMEGTIRENLEFGLKENKSFEAEALSEAMQIAQTQFLLELPGGLDYMLTDQGQGLSAGQKQRLSLMRAVMRGSKVLLLDEATSNLDKFTEAAIMKSLVLLGDGLTIVCISHRPEMSKFAQSRLRLEEGYVSVENSVLLNSSPTSIQEVAP